MNNILKTENLAVGYRSGKAETAVLTGLNLTLPEGTMTVLIGGNGAGKSTLLRTLSGAQAPLLGNIEIIGKRLGELSIVERARVVALVYTDRTLTEGLTVRELVGLGRQPYTGFFGRLSSDDRRIVAEAMEAVGIGHKADEFTSMLSDGERQKAMIARALAQQTPLIILDEPTAFLDVASRLEVIALLRRLVSDEGKTVLLSSHDLAPSLAAADRLWVVDSERGSVAEGDKEAVIASGVMDKVFPGERVRFDAAANDYRIDIGDAD